MFPKFIFYCFLFYYSQFSRMLLRINVSDANLKLATRDSPNELGPHRICTGSKCREITPHSGFHRIPHRIGLNLQTTILWSQLPRDSIISISKIMVFDFFIWVPELIIGDVHNGIPIKMPTLFLGMIRKQSKVLASFIFELYRLHSTINKE